MEDNDNRKHRLLVDSNVDLLDETEEGGGTAAGLEETKTPPPPPRKKRRTSADGSKVDHQDDPQKKAYEEENAKLQKQVKDLQNDKKELKEITCKFLRQGRSVRRGSKFLRQGRSVRRGSKFLRQGRSVFGGGFWLEDKEESVFDSDIPDHWKSDGDIAVAALRGKHVTWWDLPDDVQFDARVAAELFKLCQLKDGDLVDGAAISMTSCQDVMLAACKATGFPWYSERWYQKLLNHAKDHKGLALFAVKDGRGQRRPPELCQPDNFPCLMDRDFMKERLENESYDQYSTWKCLPSQLRFNIDFVLSIEVYRSTPLIYQILRDIEALRGKLVFWRKIVAGGAFDHALLRDEAPATVFSDRELMLDACGQKPCVLELVPHDVQRRFPDIVERALELHREERQYKEGRRDYVRDKPFEKLVDRLNPEFWRRRDFVLRWFEYGFPFLAGKAPFQNEGWKEDEEMFLLIAKNSPHKFVARSFKNASTSLRSDKEFMLSVLEYKPLLIELAEPELQQDFDLLSFVFADRSSARQYLREHQHHSAENFLNEANVELAANKSFCSTVLPAVSLTTTDPGCSLAVLNQGKATTTVYMKLIAEYSVPIGKRFCRLRHAVDNLEELLVRNVSDHPTVVFGFGQRRRPRPRQPFIRRLGEDSNSNRTTDFFGRRRADSDSESAVGLLDL